MAKSFYFPKANKDWKITLHYFDDTNEWGRTLTYEIGGNDRYFFAALPNYVKRSLASEEVSIDLKKLENLFDGIAQQVVDAFCYQFEILRVIKLDSLPGEIQEEIRRAVCLTIEHLLRNGLFQKVNDNSITTQSFTINQSAVGWINSADFTGTVAWKVLMNVLSRFKIKDKAIYYEDQLIDYKAVIDGKLEFLIKPIVEALKKDKEFEEQIAKIPHVRPFGKIRVETRLTKDPYTSEEIIVEDIDKPLNWHITGNHTAKWDKEHNELSVEVNDGENAFKELTWEEQHTHVDANGKRWYKGEIRSIKVGHLNRLNFRGTHHTHINLDDPGNTDKPELTIKVDDGLPFGERYTIESRNKGRTSVINLKNHYKNIRFVGTTDQEEGKINILEDEDGDYLKFDTTQIRSGKNAVQQIEFWDQTGQHKIHPVGYYKSLRFKAEGDGGFYPEVIIKEEHDEDGDENDNHLLIDFSNIRSGQPGRRGEDAFEFLQVNDRRIRPKGPFGLNIQSPGASLDFSNGIDVKLELKDGEPGEPGKDGVNAFNEIKVNDTHIKDLNHPIKLDIQSKGAHIENGDTIKLKVEDGITPVKKIRFRMLKLYDNEEQKVEEIMPDDYPTWNFDFGGTSNWLWLDKEKKEVNISMSGGKPGIKDVLYLKKDGTPEVIRMVDRRGTAQAALSLQFRGTARQRMEKKSDTNTLMFEINNGENAFKQVQIGEHGDIHNQHFNGLWLTGSAGSAAETYKDKEAGITWLKLNINNGRDGNNKDFIAGRPQILSLVYDYQQEGVDENGKPIYKDWPDDRPAPFEYKDVPHGEDEDGNEKDVREELIVNTHIDFKTNHFHLGKTKIDEQWILNRREEIQELQSKKQDNLIQNFGNKYEWIKEEDLDFGNVNVIVEKRATKDNHLANKKYVDDNISSAISKIDYTFRDGKYTLKTKLDMRDQNIEGVNVIAFNGTVAFYANNKKNLHFTKEGIARGITKLEGLDAPKDNGDATNKKYVDDLVQPIKDNVYKKDEVDKKIKDITIDTSKLNDLLFKKSAGGGEWSKIDNLPLGMGRSRISELADPEAIDDAVTLNRLNKEVADLNKAIGLKQNTHFHIDTTNNKLLKLDKDITHLDFGRAVLTYGEGGNETDTERRIANHKFVKNEVKLNKVFGLHTIGDTKHIIIDRDDISDTDFVLSLKDKSSRGNHITIRDVPKPKEGSDIANKEYVDEHLKDYVELTQFNIVKEDVKTNKNNIASLQTNKQDKMFKKNGNEWLYERSENINFNYKTITGIPKIPSYGSSPISKDYFEGIIQGLKNPYLKWDNSGLTYTGTNAFKFNNQRLSNVADPSYGQDAATKWYVDNEVSKLRREIQATNSRYNQAIRERDQARRDRDDYREERDKAIKERDDYKSQLSGYSSIDLSYSILEDLRSSMKDSSKSENTAYTLSSKLKLVDVWSIAGSIRASTYEYNSWSLSRAAVLGGVVNFMLDTGVTEWSVYTSNNKYISQGFGYRTGKFYNSNVGCTLWGNC